MFGYEYFYKNLQCKETSESKKKNLKILFEINYSYEYLDKYYQLSSDLELIINKS